MAASSSPSPALTKRAPGTSLYLGAVVMAMLLWSTSFVATKIALVTVPPITIGAIRFVIAAAIALTIWRLRAFDERPSRKDAIKLFGGGWLGMSAFCALQNAGVQFTSAADASLLVAAFPAITLVLEALAYRTAISWQRLLGVVVAIVGVYFLVQGSGELAGENRVLGNLVLLASGVVWALYTLITRDVTQRYSTTTVVTYQLVAGAIGLLPLTLFERSAWQMPSLDSLAMIAYLGIACSVAAFYFYSFGLRRLRPSVAAMMMNLVPLFGLAIAVVWLREALVWRELVGGALILLGILASTRTPATEPSLEEYDPGQSASVYHPGA